MNKKGVSKNTNRQFTINLAWVAVLAWMGVIFYFSHQPADVSRSLSSGLTDAVFRVVAGVFKIDVTTGTGDQLAWLHHLIRKLAHGGLYFVLALLVVNAMGRPIGRKMYLATFVFCVLYAVSDEVHQLYVPGRGGQVGDVLIDSGGALMGLGIRHVAGWSVTLLR